MCVWLIYHLHHFHHHHHQYSIEFILVDKFCKLFNKQEEKYTDMQYVSYDDNQNFDGTQHWNIIHTYWICWCGTHMHTHTYHGTIRRKEKISGTWKFLVFLLRCYHIPGFILVCFFSWLSKRADFFSYSTFRYSIYIRLKKRLSKRNIKKRNFPDTIHKDRWIDRKKSNNKQNCIFHHPPSSSSSLLWLERVINYFNN